MATYLHEGILLYLDRIADWDSYFSLTKGDDVDIASEREALRAVLETAASICEGVEADCRETWETPAKLVDGEVILPEATQKALDLLQEAGLVSVNVREEYGGFHLPGFVSNIILQMISRANPGLMTIVGLASGAAEDIQEYASPELCNEFLPRFANGEIMGSMDLTEPQAGSDLGAIQTRAVDEGEISRITGQKIFITNGGAEVHLVLARDDENYEESKGSTKGLSLFICPRTLRDGSKNGVSVERLEHKMGIHCSPTAAVRFDNAEAYRIGTKGEGFKAMLDLMNNARVGVAAQGIGIAEGAIAEAIKYAKERKQFDTAIGNQPLMKNMLSRMVRDLEGSRALLYRCVLLLDRNRAITEHLKNNQSISKAERAELERIHERNSVRTRLLTPLAKYLATESADWITRAAIQVHGGNGFMAESAVGKLHNDAIITTIYEGTSEIQVSFALKEIGKGALAIVFDELNKELDGLKRPELQEFAKKVRTGIGRIEEASVALLHDFSYALLCSRPMADMVIGVIVGAELLMQADVAPEREDLAASWVNRKMLDLETEAQRIQAGSVERIERCERIVAIFDQ
ncbi:MAG: alkylation response protein AidB-like acyl-CoA dehydrogenase [Myxococcota bacterium]|jgi:alkylation response protein AidB-like acyl-CoA dehydrogenase